MKKFYLMLLGAMAQPASAMCLAPPVHTFELNLSSCQAVEFSTHLSVPKKWYQFGKAGKGQQGTIIRGIVSGNHYVRNTDSIKADVNTDNDWQDGEFKTVFIDAEAKEFCVENKGKTLKLESLSVCCDVIPKEGYCVVPLPIAVVKSVR